MSNCVQLSLPVNTNIMPSHSSFSYCGALEPILACPAVNPNLLSLPVDRYPLLLSLNYLVLYKYFDYYLLCIKILTKRKSSFHDFQNWWLARCPRNCWISRDCCLNCVNFDAVSNLPARVRPHFVLVTSSATTRQFAMILRRRHYHDDVACCCTPNFQHVLSCNGVHCPLQQRITDRMNPRRTLYP